MKLPPAKMAVGTDAAAPAVCARVVMARARGSRSRGAGTSRRSPPSASISRGRRSTRGTCSTCPPRCGTRGPATTATARGVFVRERHARGRHRGRPRSGDQLRRLSTCSRTATSARSAVATTLACLRAVMPTWATTRPTRTTRGRPHRARQPDRARGSSPRRRTTARTRRTTTPTRSRSRLPTRRSSSTTPGRR